MTKQLSLFKSAFVLFGAEVSISTSFCLKKGSACEMFSSCSMSITSLLDSKLFLRNRVSPFVPFRLEVGANASLLCLLPICRSYSFKCTCCVWLSPINEIVGGRFPREKEADRRGSFGAFEVEIFDITLSCSILRIGPFFSMQGRFIAVIFEVIGAWILPFKLTKFLAFLMLLKSLTRLFLASFFT